MNDVGRAVYPNPEDRTMRVATTLTLAALLTGCVSANGADQWPTRYSKDGATAQDLANDGAACVPDGTFALSLIPYAGGVLANRHADAAEHAQCMVAKGWTLRAQP
jgi:hypothetical protein